MNKGVRINLAISAHGFGHLTQSLAVARALLRRVPEACLRIQCALSRELIAERLGRSDFSHDPRPLDIGLIQRDPMTVDLPATAAAYRWLHAHFADRVQQEADALRDWGATLLIGDIPYLSLAAARAAGIPAIALASLRWDLVYAAYFDLDDPAHQAIHQQMRSAYAQATLALLPEPALPGEIFQETCAIPPVWLETERSGRMRHQLGIADDDVRPLVLCSLGGIPSAQLPLERLAGCDRFHWLINAADLPRAEHLHALEGLDYAEVIGSVDAVVGKPGYGTAVEVAALGLPFVFARRGHFPDEAVIVAWLERQGRVREIPLAEWQDGGFIEHLSELLPQPAPQRPRCHGADVAAAIISERFL